MSNSGGGRMLSRDFKGVRRHAHVPVGQGFSGWMGLGVGLALGLLVALAVHLHYRNQPAPGPEPAPATAAAPASAVAPDDAIAAPSDASSDTPELDFYDVLPRQEVEVSKSTKPHAAAAARTPLPTGGAVLQAGSFKQSTEAEKMVARLAVAGVDAKIQRASVDDETWYRVRIGPIATVEALQDIESRLQEAEITATAVTPREEVPLP